MSYAGGETTISYYGDGLMTAIHGYTLGPAPTSFTQNGERYFIQSDHLGSPRVITDSSGNIIKAIDYDSYGNVIEDTNLSFEIPFGFAGGLRDKDTGLIRFGFRDYDPEAGRWTARDPIGFAGGDTNLYGYVLGDPVNWVDLFGLKNSSSSTRPNRPKRGPRGEWIQPRKPKHPYRPSNFFDKFITAMENGKNLRDSVNGALEQIGKEYESWSQRDPDENELLKCVLADCAQSNGDSCPQPDIRLEYDWLPSAPSKKSLPDGCVCLDWDYR